ncbi:hypothetical protein [Leifsonia sp. 22587]|uniref:hypothetical protein n=1 Tax=Leifsonia sp. 22587 TaxID=3453946 RepID=UPI003F86195D
MDVQMTLAEENEAIIDDLDSDETYVVRYDPKYSSRLLRRLAMLNQSTRDLSAHS